MKESVFIIRVYGIFIDETRGLLVSDEFIQGRNITKFPGGGLEYGEGTIDCLRREMREETGSEFEIINHFYTTDFFVESSFDSGRQVMSVYYLMKPVGILKIPVAEKLFDFPDLKEGSQSFRFIPVRSIIPEEFNLPIDRHVAFILQESYK